MTALGSDGMSSDESDHESGGGEPIYKISRCSWRSLRLTTWLRGLDSIHLMGRYKRMFKKTAGSWPHFRIADKTKVSERPALTGLPGGCYDAGWFSQQSAFIRGRLNVADIEVNLTHPQDIQRCVKS